MSNEDNKKREGYVKGLKDAATKPQSDLTQLAGDPHHAESYLEGYSDGQASRGRRGLHK
jgi:hypothetical protein